MGKDGLSKLEYEENRNICEIQGFKYHFINQNGYQMILEKTPAIKTNEISISQKKMLELNNIPRLLPIQFQEVDLQIKIIYSIGSKKMLSKQIQLKGLSYNYFLRFLHNLITTIQASSNYMLDEINYVLNLDFIFVEEDILDFYLVYLPAPSTETSLPVNLQIYNMILELKKYITQSPDGSIQRLEQECKDSLRFSKIKDTLVNLLSNQNLIHSNHEQLMLVDQEQFASSSNNQESKQIHLNLEKKIPNLHSTDAALSNKTEDSKVNHVILNQNNAADYLQSEFIEFLFYSIPTRMKLILSVLLFLILIIIWNLYLNSQQYEEEFYLQFCTGLTLIVIAVWFMLVSLGFPKSIKSLSWYKSDTNDINILSDVQQNPLAYEPELKCVTPESKAPISLEKYYEQLSMKTQLISHQNPETVIFETVLLPSNSNKLNNREAYLEFSRKEEIEKINLNQDVFKLGRMLKEVSYSLDEVGVSRLHFEIRRINDSFFIIDLNSKNGTFLNGEQLSPQQEYLLEHGDLIRVTIYEFTFQISS